MHTITNSVTTIDPDTDLSIVTNEKKLRKMIETVLGDFFILSRERSKKQEQKNFHQNFRKSEKKRTV